MGTCTYLHTYPLRDAKRYPLLDAKRYLAPIHAKTAMLRAWPLKVSALAYDAEV